MFTRIFSTSSISALQLTIALLTSDCLHRFSELVLSDSKKLSRAISLEHPIPGLRASIMGMKYYGEITLCSFNNGARPCRLGSCSCSSRRGSTARSRIRFRSRSCVPPPVQLPDRCSTINFEAGFARHEGPFSPHGTPTFTRQPNGAIDGFETRKLHTTVAGARDRRAHHAG